LSQVKVLIVDDEAEFATALAERLRLRNYDSQAVFNTKDALSIIKNNSYEVVLLDFEMPGMDGIEVLKIMKQTDPTLEVIMLTGGGKIKNMQEVMQIGAFDYLMKPVDLGELIIQINNAKKRRSLVK
jgi:DNA-binding NtrC family response regulator